MESIENLPVGSLRSAKTSNSRELAEMRALLRRAFDEALTPRQKRCLTMYYFDSMTMAQIGSSLGLDESTVSRHIKAARKKLGILQKLL